VRYYVDPDGNQMWFDDGNDFHRDDGPAVIFADGRKKWCYHSHWIDCESQEEFERALKLKAFW
jgi:hypothetical protein